MPCRIPLMCTHPPSPSRPERAPDPIPLVHPSGTTLETPAFSHPAASPLVRILPFVMCLVRPIFIVFFNGRGLPRLDCLYRRDGFQPVSYTHLRAHETPEHLVCR